MIFYYQDEEGLHPVEAESAAELDPGKQWMTSQDGENFEPVDPGQVFGQQTYGFAPNSLEQQLAADGGLASTQHANVPRVAAFLRAAGAPQDFAWKAAIQSAAQAQGSQGWSSFDDPGQTALKILSGINEPWAQQGAQQLKASPEFAASQAEGAQAWNESQIDNSTLGIDNDILKFGAVAGGLYGLQGLFGAEALGSGGLDATLSGGFNAGTTAANSGGIQLASAAGATDAGTAGIGALAGAADPIEAMILAAETTGASTATEAAAALGFASTEAMLASINPAWVTAGAMTAGTAAQIASGANTAAGAAKKDSGLPGWVLPAALGAGALGVTGTLGGQQTTQTSSTAPMGDEERELIALQGELAKKQLSNVESLQPFQKALLEAAMADIERIQGENRARDAVLSPAQRAQFELEEFDRSRRLGTMQDELLAMQLGQAKQGTRATPEQIAEIKAATDAALEAGYGDIDRETQKGIGLISDELANSRGLRLTDSPIMAEAGRLVENSNQLKSGLTRNLRASEAQARLNYPLAVNELNSKVNLGTQSLVQSAKDFQSQLRERAYQNRLALTGQTGTTGIGLSSVGSGNGALSALTNSRMANATTSTDKGIGLNEIGQLASGIGGLAIGGSRLGLWQP